MLENDHGKLEKSVRSCETYFPLHLRLFFQFSFNLSVSRANKLGAILSFMQSLIYVLLLFFVKKKAWKNQQRIIPIHTDRNEHPAAYF
jgi:hypothetical protein